MKTKAIAVIASASSRLHADVMLIRLRRAGIACQKISALFPRNSIPNSVACWLKLDQERTLHVGDETVVPAGPIRSQLHHNHDAASVAEWLEGAGVDHVSGQALVEKVEQGHTLLSVTTTSEDEASIAWHVFKHVSADCIVVGEHGTKEKSRTQRRDQATPLPLWAAAAA